MASPAKSPDEEDSKSWMEWRVRNVAYTFVYIKFKCYIFQTTCIIIIHEICKIIFFSPRLL
jgi:hypothetical protein